LPDAVVASAPAPAEPSTAAPASSAAPKDSELDGELDGCLASVKELPELAWLDRDDRRLSRDDLVVVSKSARRLVVFADGERTHCWKIALGFAPVGHKEVQGDGKTPEGWYRTSDKPWSTFDNAIAIHYPNVADARAAKLDGRISRATHDKIAGAIDDGKVPPQSTALGGAILIHGGGTSFDWTLGCVALADRDLIALREILPRGMRTDLLVLP
jgi:murein L,D-transpeptidase YafK